MTKTWYTPGGTYSAVAADMLKQTHLLIAGATGSGKSVLLNSIICTALYKAPHRAQFILIDPKIVELQHYKKLPHTLAHATNNREIINALEGARNIMNSRFREMVCKGLRETTDGHIYIVIDEYADLATGAAKRTTTPLIDEIARKGRAAHIHIIAATQRPTREVIGGSIKVNIDSRVALRCPAAQDSRNIIGLNGAEALPKIGYAYYQTADGLQLVKVPFTPDQEIDRLVKWWTDQK